MNNRTIGSGFEKQAAAFLQSKGYRILEMNFRCRQGEVDIVAQDGRYLVFVEVKYRRSNEKGNPLEAVDIRKQRQISRVCLFYMSRYGVSEDTPIRFDVVGITDQGCTLIQNAFDYVG
ncbi:MAG: YraN family protein [Lachnospiraceae bacterium]|nr:YraN family protein [Candidatus Equihabitans merdae]